MAGFPAKDRKGVWVRGETGWGRSQPAGEGEGKRQTLRRASEHSQAVGREPPDLLPDVYRLFWKTLVSFDCSSVCGSCCILEVIECKITLSENCLFTLLYPCVPGRSEEVTRLRVVYFILQLSLQLLKSKKRSFSAFLSYRRLFLLAGK